MAIILAVRRKWGIKVASDRKGKENSEVTQASSRDSEPSFQEPSSPASPRHYRAIVATAGVAIWGLFGLLLLQIPAARHSPSAWVSFVLTFVISMLSIVRPQRK